MESNPSHDNQSHSNNNLSMSTTSTATTGTGSYIPSNASNNDDLVHLYDPNEQKVEHLPTTSHLGLPPHQNYRYPLAIPHPFFPNMGHFPPGYNPIKPESLPPSMPMLPFPGQYPPNMMYHKQNPFFHVQSQVPYPLGMFQSPAPTTSTYNYSHPQQSSASPQSPPHSPTSSMSSAISQALLTNQNLKTPQIIYRNLFHTMHCKFKTDNGEWEGCRIYINDNVGYSGNAKRFKKKPEKGEKALLLECAVLTSNDQPATQCLSCRDYFETQKYYKANPDCIGRIVLVKNNAPIRVENGQFKILIKMMCCCVHHTVDYFTFQLNLLDGDVDKTPQVVFSAKIPLSVKQWRKSNQKKEECLTILEPKT